MNTIVEHINSAGFSFVEFALPMLIQSSVLIAILLLADLLLRKKVKAVFRYWIWMLVLLKLILPASLSSPLSLGYLFGDKLTYQDLAQTSATLEPTEPAPADISPGINPIYIQPNAYIPPTAPMIPGVEPVASEPVGPPAASVTPVTWQGVVFLIWLAVVITMGLLLFQRALFVRGLVAQAKEAGRLMNDALVYCCACMGIKSKVGLKISVNATTPSVCGLIRPVILVPWNLASTLGASRLRTVLMHELAHIKRGDLWVNLAQTALQIIYFYNPLLWLANCVIRRIREQAVDEAVLVAMGAKAQKYPQTLVDVAKLAFKRPALSLRLIGVVESKSALAGRIKHILGRPMPRSAKLGIVGMLAIIIAGAVLLPMARAEKNQKLLRGIDEKLKVTDKAGELTINSLYMPSPNGKDIIRANKVTMYVDVTNNSEKDIYLGLEYYTDSGTVAVFFSPGASSRAQIRRVPANWQGKLEYPIRYRRFAKGGYISITLARCAGKQIMKEKGRAVLPPEVEVIYEKKYNIVPIDGTQPDEGALTDSSFTATLPNGVTVELVGICEHPSKDKQWWRPDGSLLGQSPVRNIDVGGYNIRRGEAAYELVAKLTGPETLLSRSSTPEKWKVPQARKVGGGKSGTAKDKSGKSCLRATTAEVKNGLEKIDIEFGLAGVWEKRLTISSNESSKQKIRDTGVVINPPYEKDSNATVTIKIPNKIDSKMAINITAVLKNGKVIGRAAWNRNSKFRFMRSTDNYEFHGVNLSDVDHFEIYTSKYQWVEFKDVSLQPGLKTNVQIEGESEKISGVVGIQDSTLGKSTSAEAAFIIQKVLDRYAAIKTYSAIGELLTDVDQPLEAMGVMPGMKAKMLQQMGEQQLKSIFTIKMARPNLYCIEWSENIDTDLSKVGNAWSVGDGSYGLVHGKEKSFEKTLRALIWTANNMGRVQSSLFFDTSLNTLRVLRDLSQQEDEQLEGVDCYVISGSLHRRTYTYWVSKKDFLIRQYKSVSGGDGKPIEGAGHELTDETIKESLKAMDKEATPEEIAKMRAMLTAANAMASEVKVTNTETYRNIILDQPISEEQFVPSKDIDEITEELKNLRAKYIHRLKNISPTEPNLKTDVQVEGEYNNSLYQKQGAIRYALEFIGTPEELIDTTLVSKYGQLANPQQLEFANKLFSVRKSKDVDMFISLLSDGTKKQLNDDDNNKRMLHHHIKEVKDGTFLYGEYDFKFFVTFRKVTEKLSEMLKKHVSFAETPSHAIHYWHFHKPDYMLIGESDYLIEDEGSYKLVPETLLSEPVIPAKKEQPTGPKEYGIVAFKQTDNAYTQPTVWKYEWNIELKPDVSENNTFQILKTTKVVSGQADLHPEIAAQKIIDESMIEKYKYDILKCRFYVGNSEPRYNYHQYGRKLSGWLCGLSIANTSKSTSMLFPGKDVTNVKPNKQGNFIGSDLELISFETSEENIRYEHKVILRKDDSPEAKSAALLRLEQMTRRRISNKKLQYLNRILTAYANDHNSEYPDRLVQIKSYDTDEWLDWLLENIEYLGKGKTLTETSKTVIAYDKTLLEKAGSTNVLFNEGPVQYCNPNWLKKIGITGVHKSDVQVEGGSAAKRRKVYLPDLYVSRKILDLASGKLVAYPLFGEPLEKVLKAIQEKGKGDLFYARNALAFLRGSQPDQYETIKESGVLCKIYRIGVSFPQTITVTTKEGRKYKVKILSADEKGCQLEYYQEGGRRSTGRKPNVQVETKSDRTIQAIPLKAFEFKLVEKLLALVKQVEKQYPEQATHWPAGAGLYHIDAQGEVTVWHYRALWRRSTDCAEDEVGWGSSQLVNAKGMYYLPDGTPLQSRWRERGDGMKDIRVKVGRTVGENERVPVIHRHRLPSGHDLLSRDGLERIILLDSWKDLPLAIIIRVDRPMRLAGWWLGDVETDSQHFNEYDQLIVNGPPGNNNKPMLVTVGLPETDVQVEGEPMVSKLLAALENEKYVHIREPIIQMVEEIGDKEPISFLTEQLKSENRTRRCNAALALELLGDRRGVPAIIKELNDTSYRPIQDTSIRSDSPENLKRKFEKRQIRQDHYYAALLLGILGDERAVPALIEATWDETINYRAATSLGEIGDKRAVPALRAMLERLNKPSPRLFAGYGLAMLGDEEGLEVVIDTLNNHQVQWTVCRHAIEALGKLGDKQAVPHLIVALKDDHPNIRVSAARALGAIGDASALPALEEALKDNTETKVNAPTTVSKAAAEAIAQIKAGDMDKTDMPVEVEQSGKTSQPKPAKPTAQEDSEHAGRISGVVVNSVTGEPIAGAYVGVGDFGDSGGSNYSRHRSQGFHDKTKTDEKGRFELDGLVFTDDHPYLKYHPLVVTHPDFVRHDEKIKLLKDKPVPDVKVSLRPAAKIDVTIVDADGNPLEGHWLIRLEALDGRRFIPPGSDPHLSSFASSIWAHMPDLRTKMGASQGFTFTELDTGRYSIEAIRFHLVDNPTPQNIWKPTITYHGSIPSLKIQAGQAKQVQLSPQDHQTRLTITPPEFPDKLMDKLERSSQMPLMCLISRSPGLLLWGDVKIYHLEDQRLGRIDRKRFFRGFFPLGKPLTINNLPPDSYSLFAMAVYGQVAGCLIGARADLAKGDNVTLDIPWRQPTGPSMVGPNRSFDYPVKLEARDYSASELCEILTDITESNPRIIADSLIENEKLSFGKGQMPVWDVLEALYLQKGWKVDEGADKTLVIKPADKIGVQVEVEKRREARVESTRKLQDIGKALLIYTNDHEEKYPDALHDIKSYLRDEKAFNWILENVEYLAKGKTLADRPDTPIAYDETLIEKGNGTNILFNDGRVKFLKIGKFKELGIIPEKPKDQIQFDAKRQYPILLKWPLVQDASKYVVQIKGVRGSRPTISYESVTNSLRLEKADVAPGRYQWSVSVYDKYEKFMGDIETIDPVEIFAIEDPQPVAANGKRVLIDLSHSAGHMRGWGIYNHAQYMTKELLENAGFEVEVNNRDLLTANKLKSVDLLICHYYWAGWPGFRSYLKSELSAVRKFVEKGGSLLVVGCDRKDGGGKMREAGNELVKEFGLLFELDKISEQSKRAQIVTGQNVISFAGPIYLQLPVSVQGENAVTLLRFNGEPLVKAKQFGKGKVIVAGVGMSFLDCYLGDFEHREPLHLVMFYDFIKFLTNIDWKEYCKQGFIETVLSRCQFQRR